MLNKTTPKSRKWKHAPTS